MTGDAWHEFSGWDGRFARTLGMLARPGALTIEVVEGRRARYVSPLRVYLTASVIFFLVAAVAPSLQTPQPVAVPGMIRNIDLLDPRLSAEDRETARKQIQRAPWWARALMQPTLDNPDAVKTGFRERFGHALFAFVPVFAVIVGLFYRRRRFFRHLAFALHLHAAAFLMLAFAQLWNLSRSLTLVRLVSAGTAILIAAYALKAFRTVYAESWPRTIVKAVAIAPLYSVVLAIAIFVTFVWTILR